MKVESPDGCAASFAARKIHTRCARGGARADWQIRVEVRKIQQQRNLPLEALD